MSEVKTSSRKNPENNRRNRFPGGYLLASSLLLAGLTATAVVQGIDSYKDHSRAEEEEQNQESAAQVKALAAKNSVSFGVNQQVPVPKIALPHNFEEILGGSISDGTLLRYGAAVFQLPTNLTEETVTNMDVSIGFNGILYYPKVSDSKQTGPLTLRLSGYGDKVTNDTSEFHVVSNVDLGNTTIEITKDLSYSNTSAYELTFESTETSIPEDAVLIVTQDN